MNGVVFRGESTGEGNLRLLDAGEAYAGWRRGGRRGRKRKEEARQVGQRANQVTLVMLIGVLFGKSLEIIPRGSPYSGYPRVLMAVVLMAITMVVMLLMLLTALTARFDARSGDRTGKRKRIE